MKKKKQFEHVVYVCDEMKKKKRNTNFRLVQQLRKVSEIITYMFLCKKKRRRKKLCAENSNALEFLRELVRVTAISCNYLRNSKNEKKNLHSFLLNMRNFFLKK